jgi:metacaspase-1
VELPFVYRTDDYGNINLVDTVKQGVGLLSKASRLFHSGLNPGSMGEARELIVGATGFFKGLSRRGEPKEDGLEEEHFAEDWAREGKTVFMFSGCADDQTSADTSIGGQKVGAVSRLNAYLIFLLTSVHQMSWAFLETMRKDTNWNMSYIQVPIPRCWGKQTTSH